MFSIGADFSWDWRLGLLTVLAYDHSLCVLFSAIWIPLWFLLKPVWPLGPSKLRICLTWILSLWFLLKPVNLSVTCGSNYALGEYQFIPPLRFLLKPGWPLGHLRLQLRLVWVLPLWFLLKPSRIFVHTRNMPYVGASFSSTVVLIKTWVTSCSFQVPNMPYVVTSTVVFTKTRVTSRSVQVPYMPYVVLAFPALDLKVLLRMVWIFSL